MMEQASSTKQWFLQKKLPNDRDVDWSYGQALTSRVQTCDAIATS
jgi:hypothetical protein